MIFNNFRIVDHTGDFLGSLVIENAVISEVIRGGVITANAGMVIDGRLFPDSVALMPAFIDLHAHFRDSGLSEKGSLLPAELLESASLAAVAGGFTTIVCMANTSPVISTVAQARALKSRSDNLGLIDLYPVLPLTKNMEGAELSGLNELPSAAVLMLSEDGKDVADDGLFLGAMREAKRLGIPVSCHCDFGGPEAEAMKTAGRPRSEWSRIEENNAVRRAIALGQKAGCHIHIAHVSTAEAAETIRAAKHTPPLPNGFRLTCEATPHHIGATEADARRMGEESYGRVNPPLRTEADRQAVIAALGDGTIDAIATDHAPHREQDKTAGTPGFIGLEAAFSVCVSNNIPLQNLSALMSARPASILGLDDRGGIARGLRADLVMVDTQALVRVDPERCKSRGKCSPFTGRDLRGKILMTLNAGKIVFQGE